MTGVKCEFTLGSIAIVGTMRAAQHWRYTVETAYRRYKIQWLEVLSERKEVGL